MQKSRSKINIIFEIIKQLPKKILTAAQLQRSEKI